MMDEKYYDAINHFTETIVREEALPLTFLYLGECYERTGELILAEQNYLRSIELDEEFAEAYVAMALLKMNTGHHVESDFYITKAISLDQQNPDFWYINAEISENASNFTKAKEAYEKAISFDETNIEILVDYSNFIQNQDGLIEAINMMLEKESDFQENELYNFRLSSLYYMHGKLQIAYRFFEKGIEINQNAYNLAFEFYPQMENDQHIQYLINSNFKA
jgi:Tfp pilus assembly protein PilF